MTVNCFFEGRLFEPSEVVDYFIEPVTDEVRVFSLDGLHLADFKQGVEAYFFVIFVPKMLLSEKLLRLIG